MTAVVLSYNRGQIIGDILAKLLELPLDEIIVVDNESVDGSADIVRRFGPPVRLIEAGGNLGAPGRNLGAEAASTEYVVFLDDDSYPEPGAIEALRAVFEARPDVGVVGGLVRELGPDGELLLERGLGSFDWYLRGGATGPPPPDGFPAFFFPEGACMVRRRAFLDVGGFYRPYFLTASEVDVATRLLKSGWDVRYLPTAAFGHLRASADRTPGPMILRYRVRNQLWYSWLRFPLDKALIRMVGYLLFDFVQAAYRRSLGAWAGGALDAWRQRDLIRGDRDPVPRELVARVELGRGRMHLRLLAGQLRSRLPGARPGPV